MLKGQQGQKDIKSPLENAHNVQEKSRSNFFVLKVRKLTSALYIITAGMNHEDSLRHSIRDTATTLLGDSIRKLARQGTLPVVMRSELLGQMDTLLAYLIVLETSGMAGRELVAVLQKELGLLRSILTSSEEIFGLYDYPLPNGFFSVEGDNLSNATFERGTSHKGQYNISHIGQQPVRPIESSRTLTVFRGTKDGMLSMLGKHDPTKQRKALILSQFSAEKGYSIKDIAAAIPGVGEKTVQRELVALVVGGFLEKRGERRWSRYYYRAGKMSLP